jgi:hypothetical protein
MSGTEGAAVLDDLDHRVGKNETRLRETRLLLAQQKHRRAATPEETLALAAKLFQALSETEALAIQLNARLKSESEKRTQALRAHQYDPAATDKLLRELGLKAPLTQKISGPGEEAGADSPDFGSQKFFGNDTGGDDGAAGNAPVPSYPRRPVPVLAGGAERRFEESDEPPRSP